MAKVKGSIKVEEHGEPFAKGIDYTDMLVPKPRKLILEPIESLMTKDNLSKNEKYGFTRSLDPDIIKHLLTNFVDCSVISRCYGQDTFPYSYLTLLPNENTEVTDAENIFGNASVIDFE